MFGFCNCCAEASYKPVFIIGSDKDKEKFLDGLGIVTNKEQYQEYRYKAGSENVVFSCLNDKLEDPNIEEEHIKNCLGVVYLSPHDHPITIKKPVFFIYTAGESKQISKDNFVVYKENQNLLTSFQMFLKELQFDKQ